MNEELQKKEIEDFYARIPDGWDVVDIPKQ